MASSSNKRPCPSETKEEAEPVVVLVECFEDVGNYVSVRSLASMDEPVVFQTTLVKHDLGRLCLGETLSLPRTHHDLWSTPDGDWESCKREDKKSWTPVPRDARVEPIHCVRTYFWEH